MLKPNRYHPDIKEIISLNDLAVEYHKKHDMQNAYKICKKIYELETAPDILKQSIDLGIKHMRYHLIMGEIYYSKGYYAEAQKILNSLKSLGKHFSDKYLILAKIHLKNEDYTKALQEYEEMTIECPQRFKSILNGLLDIINQEPFIERSYRLMFKLYKNRGKESSAISKLEQKLKEENYHQHHLVSIFGHIYHYMGETSRAISLLTQYQKENPKDAKPFFFIGNIYLETGKYSEAITQYNHVIELDPSRQINIISSIEEISNIKEVDNIIINYLVDLYIDEGKLEQAEKKLDHLLEIEPKNIQNQSKMEQVLAKSVENAFLNEQIEICMLKLEKLTKLRPENAKYKKKMQDIQGLLAQKKITKYEERLKSDDLSEEKANNIRFELAKLYVNAGINEESAISLFQQVAKSDSENKAESLLQIGNRFLAKGYNDIANDSFNKILELNLPEEEKLNNLYQIATAYEKTKSYDRARFFYSKILSTNMQYKDVSTRLDKISAFTESTPNAKSSQSTDVMKKLEERYEDIENIGEGGMGIVYKATDKVLKRTVAIKIIREDYKSNSEAVERFIKEAQSLSKLQHIGIVTIYDINLGTPMYIIMEYVDGETLRSSIGKKPFSLQEVLRIAIDTCDAIKYAHKHEIVHRDIKPDNIMLTKSKVVKITDFGLAHIANSSMFTKAGQTIGTPYYMSPEQIRGQKVDGRSDIYSLGITFYEMLIGRVPFNQGDVAYQHINEIPKSIVIENPKLPRWLDSIIQKCIKKDPSERYQEISHLQKELEAYSKFYIEK
ncbi:MAG: serine/threonine protein kinase [Candidatus Scalindua rubra]|uniref:non-specific serine/threonine protein kinase n=1 Tax=Candidatus Scalindua rubra TaxID=1872076 RepID=A0A1E3XDB7_9BACT|nr:MAG: serine/threonine protein kinase [Candidatus Scalindua rubra]